MKRRITLTVLLLASMLLSACSITINSNREKEDDTTSSTYKIGQKILEEGKDAYYYGGVVYDSVVINVVKYQSYNNAHTLPLYIDLGIKSSVVKLPGSNTSIKIEDIDRNKGTATITLNK